MEFCDHISEKDTQAVAGLLREYAQTDSLRAGNPYRAKAYLRAADSLAALSKPLARVIATGKLTEIPGIGDATSPFKANERMATGFRAL